MLSRRARIWIALATLASQFPALGFLYWLYSNYDLAPECSTWTTPAWLDGGLVLGVFVVLPPAAGLALSLLTRFLRVGGATNRRSRPVHLAALAACIAIGGWFADSGFTYCGRSTAILVPEQVGDAVSMAWCCYWLIVVAYLAVCLALETPRPRWADLG